MAGWLKRKTLLQRWRRKLH